MFAFCYESVRHSVHSCLEIIGVRLKLTVRTNYGFGEFCVCGYGLGEPANIIRLSCPRLNPQIHSDLTRLFLYFHVVAPSSRNTVGILRPPVQNP
jgi:hypothetical protein